jgi:hypothetical protein
VKALELVEIATSLSPERQESVKKEITDLLDRVLQEESDGPPSDKKSSADIPVISYGPSSIITQATKAIELQFNMDQGRHLVVSSGKNVCKKVL